MKVLRDKTPVARKEHRCNFCGGVISVGEKYNRQTNVYDGRVDDWVSHCECSKLACELDMFDDCDEGLDVSIHTPTQGVTLYLITYYKSANLIHCYANHHYYSTS